MTLGRHYGHGPLQALALHCSLAHAGEWSGLGAALGELLTITACDLPGHGKAADWVPGTDIAAAAEAVALAALSPGRVDLIGHSFGAVVALRLALAHPARVRRLILIEPTLFAAAAGTAAAADLVVRQGASEAAWAAGDAERAAELFIRIWGTGEAWEQLPEAQRRYVVQRIGLIFAARPVLDEDSGRLLAPGRLEGFRQPVLLLEGGASPPVIAAIASALAARLPMAERQVVPGAGHMLPVTHNAEVAAAIRGFLSRG